MRYAAIFLMLAACASNSPQRGSPSISHFSEVWLIRSSTGWASGFIVQSDRVGTTNTYNNFMVTAKHAAKDVLGYTAFKQDKPMLLQGRRLVMHDKKDVAIIVFKTKGKLPHLTLAKKAPRFMDRLYAAGYPAWPQLRVTVGHRAKSPESMTCPVASGASGGPVFNEDGEVIGIVEQMAVKRRLGMATTLIYHVSQYESLTNIRKWFREMKMIE